MYAAGPAARDARSTGGDHNAPVVCVGETMALLVPADGGSLRHAVALTPGQAGAESNVAVGLARLGTPVSWVSRVGDDPWGERIRAELTSRGVGTGQVVVDQTRPTGVVFKDPAPEGSRVHYYRAGSAASALGPGDLAAILASRPRWIHISGVTCALSASCLELVTLVFDAARELGIPTSFDVNHRPRLWPDLATAAETLASVARRADVVLVGLDEAFRLWGTATADDVRVKLGIAHTLVVKDGARSADSFGTDGSVVTVPALPVDVVEPVGAGDAFAAGWIHGRIEGWDEASCLRLGHLMAGVALRAHDDHGEIDDVQALRRAALDGAPWHQTDDDRGADR